MAKEKEEVTRVKFFQRWLTGGVSYKKGQVADLPVELAKELLYGGHVELVKSKPKSKAKE